MVRNDKLHARWRNGAYRCGGALALDGLFFCLVLFPVLPQAPPACTFTPACWTLPSSPHYLCEPTRPSTGVTTLRHLRIWARWDAVGISFYAFHLLLLCAACACER